MIVVSDTSVISGLLQSNSLFILQRLYKRIIIPNEVLIKLDELDQKYLDELFVDWIEIRKVQDTLLLAELNLILDPGEAEAIALAKELNADLLLIDETRGRKYASKMGIRITGILGTLIEAKNQRHINEIKPIIETLVNQLGVWFSRDLIIEVFTQVNEINTK